MQYDNELFAISREMFGHDCAINSADLLSHLEQIIDEIIYQPHTWPGAKVGVFRVEDDREDQIGEYERNYPTLYIL